MRYVLPDDMDCSTGNGIASGSLSFSDIDLVEFDFNLQVLFPLVPNNSPLGEYSQLYVVELFKFKMLYI